MVVLLPQKKIVCKWHHYDVVTVLCSARKFSLVHATMQAGTSTVPRAQDIRCCCRIYLLCRCCAAQVQQCCWADFILLLELTQACTALLRANRAFHERLVLNAAATQQDDNNQLNKQQNAFIAYSSCTCRMSRTSRMLKQQQTNW